MIKNHQQKGTVLIIAFLALAALFILGSSLLTFTLTDFKISESQESGIKTYYLAEAGINEAIWKLKNDDTWSNQFITNPTWSANFSRSFAGGSYTVSIQNSKLAQGEIISTAKINLDGEKTSQRIIKTVVFKALGSSVNNRAMFTEGPGSNISMSSSNITINDGNSFCGGNLNISSSTLIVRDNEESEGLEGQLLVHNNLIESSATITSEMICAKNQCDAGCDICPPSSSDLPSVDFNSSDPNSFKSRAQALESAGQCQILCDGNPCSAKCLFTSSQFSSILSSGSDVTINSKITYVTGSVNVSSKNLTINGILIAEDDIDVSSSSLSVNRPDSQSPSGLISGKKVNFNSTTINITGVLYSLDQMDISSSSGTVTGGILGRKFDFSNIPFLNINLNNDIITYGLGYMVEGIPVSPNLTFSPVIMVDHWEESY